MPKRAPKPVAPSAVEKPNEAPASGGFSERAPVVAVDSQLVDLADLLRHIEGAPRSQVPALVADGLKRIEAIRASLD